MSIEALLAELRRLEIRLWVEGDRLLFSAAPGSLSDELRQRIRAHKPELVSLLKGVESGRESSPPASPVDDRHRTPLGFAQQRLWFLAQMEPDSGGYNVPVALRLTGTLDAVALQRALECVVARHEALRTSFPLVGEEPCQRVGPAPELRVEIEDLRALAAEERDGSLRRRLQREALRGFDLERGPLFRVLLLRLAEAEHALLLVMHHIVSDGWSLAVLMRELSVCYGALRRGQEPQLPPLPAQYGDFVRWQRDYLQGQELQRQVGYWRSKLAGLEQLDLPIDKPRPAYPGTHGGAVGFSLPRELSVALRELCRRHAVTPFMLLLAAFAVLLCRYSGQADVAVGTPIAGRRGSEFEKLIGFFVNTLVLRLDLAGNPSFAELLDRVREVALEAFDHQDLPFDKLVEELAPPRDASRNPLFQVMFAFHNAPESELDLDGLQVARVPLELGREKFDLSLSMRDTPQGLVGSFSYSTALFDAATIARMSRHFRHLLESVARGVDQPVHSLSMLGEDELRLLLHERNSTGRACEADTCIHELIERQAAMTPERVAVVCGNVRLSYAELNARANRLAHFLRASGVGPDELVGLCLAASQETVVAILGVLKAGGAYVPLDPAYPADRLAFMLEDSGVRIVLVDGERPAIGPATDRRIVRLDLEQARIATYPVENPRTVVGGSNLAYMIYTSGSTGTPKGVLIEHRSVRNLAEGLRERYGLEPGGAPLRNCLSTSIAFDASVDNWVMLGFGDELHVVDEALGADSAALLRYLREQQIDVFDCTPTQLGLMLDDGLLEGSWVPRIIGVGGEPVDPGSWQSLANCSRTTAYNLYGPTECTVEATAARIDARVPVPVIGRPLANVRVYLLDAYGHPVPSGATGEIWIGGEGLARGYHRRAELTAERFVIHQLPGLPPQRLYRTGDFGRYLADGSLCFLGRRDGLVKFRGHTVELGEIEAVLAQIPGVGRAVALLRHDDPQNPVLVAYVQAEHGAPLREDELRGAARAKLPTPMVPSAFVVVDRLPQTPNGKVDRRALPPPVKHAADCRPGYAPASTGLQEQLLSIWNHYIESERIGIDDDFFALGGHSLLATRVINRISRDCDVRLPLRLVFERPTIRGLAEAIEDARNGGEATGNNRAGDRITAQPRVARKLPKPGE